MRSLTIMIGTIAIVLTVTLGAIQLMPKTPTPIVDDEPLVVVTSLKSGDTIASPVIIEGRARGSWYFEASFPIQVFDANGTMLGSTPAQAQGDWMTTDVVPFKATVPFSTPTTSTGSVVLKKDNPSGLPQNEDELRVPVTFKQITRSVNLFYYDANKDKDASGVILCSKQGLVPVIRTIPVTITPIQDSVNLLLKGELTSQEKTAGVTTEYPLGELALKGSSLHGTTLTLELTDPQHKTSGGSCRASILWSQIEATVLQFSEVKSVNFIPADLFQP